MVPRFKKKRCYQQEKLISGLDAACRHTRVSHDDVRALADRVKVELMARGIREITSRELGDLVMLHLREIDVVAYIRFACVYKRFKDIRELSEAIEGLAPVQKPENEEPAHAIEKN